MSDLMKIRVGDHASDVLAVEIVVGDIDVPDAPVGVVVAVGARTEGAVIPQGRGAPVVLVMAEAVHSNIRLTMILLPRDLFDLGL